jgi:hypothetical protein
VDPRRQPSLSFLSPLIRLTHAPVNRTNRGSAAGPAPPARAGWRAAELPGWHARQGPARARDGRRPGKKGMDATALPNEHPRRAGASPGAPPAPGRRRAKGIEGFSPRDPAAQIQKEGAGVAWRQSQPPPLGVSTSTTRPCAQG